MWSWLALAIAAAPQPDLACSLQPGGEWATGPREVSAVSCEGRAGFFVPSLEYRAILDPRESEPYRLLEEELRLSKLESAELRSAISMGELSSARWKELYAIERIARVESQEEARNLRASWSPGTWVAVGAGVGLVAAAAIAIGLAAAFAGLSN